MLNDVFKRFIAQAVGMFIVVGCCQASMAKKLVRYWFALKKALFRAVLVCVCNEWSRVCNKETLLCAALARDRESGQWSGGCVPTPRIGNTC